MLEQKSIYITCIETVKIINVTFYKFLIMKKNLLIPTIVGISVSLISLASFVFIGNLVNLNFNITASYANINLINANLGNITAGSNGAVEFTTTINVHKPGDYIFVLENSGILQEEFSNFSIVIQVQNSSLSTTMMLGGSNITGWNFNNTIYLNTGTYNLEIYIYYSVSPNAIPLSFNGNIVEVEYET